MLKLTFINRHTDAKEPKECTKKLAYSRLNISFHKDESGQPFHLYIKPLLKGICFEDRALSNWIKE